MSVSRTAGWALQRERGEIADSSISFGTCFYQRLSATDGVFDVMKVAEYATQWFAKLPLFPSYRKYLESLSRSFFKAATVINLWEYVKSIETTISSISLLGRLCYQKGSLSAQDRRIQDLAKESARNLLDVTGGTLDTVNNFHEAGWIDLGKSAPICSGVYCGIDIVANGLDIGAQVAKVEKREKELIAGTSEKRRAKIYYKNIHSYMQLFKSAVCITGSTVGLISLLIGGPVILSYLGLICSTLWITSKIVAHFYKEMVVNNAVTMRCKNL